jgi:hypothetical protein
MNASPMRCSLLVGAVVLALPSGWAQIRSVTRPTLQIPPVINLFAYPGAPARMAMGWGQQGAVAPAGGVPVTASLTPALAVVPAVEKSGAEQAEIQRRVVAFQRRRAEAGRPGAQYDLAMSYLSATGVEQDVAEARKWLERAAFQGHGPARQALRRLDDDPAEGASPKATPGPAASGW